MSHARIRSGGQEYWYDNVKSVLSDGHYVTLTLTNHPRQVNYYRPPHGSQLWGTSVLLAETAEDVRTLLQEETAQRLHTEGTI